ncbi:SACOL1771 family peroxiredoxin [Desmospora profundinema]|uniref:Peroxiredoxin-like protein n=1 Tax=Desmospora profundinema TaxID=1571184 RepID=A0ABU1IPH4_9BACL|nr:SACOL1771 family peroxiredoxin [Desmospora profundinema]MDR6226692.1 peroxiredoxin-like protein [Desmospora profundinema]
MAKHHFHLTARWQGGRNGIGTIDAGNLKSEISIPEEMRGPGVGTNPDEMLIGSAATCYLITLAAMLERAAIPVKELTLETEGVVREERGLKFERITHRPTVILEATATAGHLEQTEAATERAERHCMISNALRGNVELAVEANVSVVKD